MAPPKTGADEFDIIARYFAPLATNAGARKLLDDAAILNGLIITTDAIVEGVHFLPNDPLDLVARKALRVNLSDLAAKGARPLHYLLTLAWPKTRPADEIEKLAAGLAQDQAEFDVSLIGGDTVSTPGPLTLSVTAFGEAGVRTPSRADAKVGDDIWVTGFIGDGGLGLAALRGEEFPFYRPPHPPAMPTADLGDDRNWVIGAYRLPAAPVIAAELVAEAANASMDVSDGLIADAAKIAAASGVGMDIRLENLPVSPAARRWIARQIAGGTDEAQARRQLASFGDDYQILFTAPPEHFDGIRFCHPETSLSVQWIGKVREGAGVTLTFKDQPVEAGAGGWVHGLGA